MYQEFSKEDNILEFNGGAFLVRDKTKGGEDNEIGWAYILIVNMKTIEIGYYENTTKLTKPKIQLIRVRLQNEISEKHLEKISIMCNRGFNTHYAYNFSQCSTYLYYAQEFFLNLSKN
jgi:hypothetical protein